MPLQELYVIKNHFSDSIGAQSPVVEHDYAVGQLANQRQVVRGQNERSRKTRKDFGQLATTAWVEIGEWFVQGEAAGTTGQNARQAGPFAFAEREPGRVAFGERFEIDVCQGLIDAGLDFGVIQIQVQGPEGDVTADRGPEELVGGVLEQHPDATPNFRGVFWGRRKSVDGDRGAMIIGWERQRFGKQGVEVQQQCRLAGPAGAQKCHSFGRRNPESDVVEHIRSTNVTERQILNIDGDGGRHRGGPVGEVV